MPSFRSSHAGPNYQKSGPTLPVKQCKGASICLSTAYEGVQTLFMGPRGAIHSYCFTGAPRSFVAVKFGVAWSFE
jgi:hypothetical protein